jgi:hypothetical protein
MSENNIYAWDVKQLKKDFPDKRQMITEIFAACEALENKTKERVYTFDNGNCDEGCQHNGLIELLKGVGIEDVDRCYTRSYLPRVDVYDVAERLNIIMLDE